MLAMLFHETNNKNLPTIILLHGGGLSDWSLKEIVEIMKDDFHVVTTIIDGHGVNGDKTFISIEHCAKELIEYIDVECNGKVFALGGLSIGAQIVVEALSQKSDVTSYAIIESALVFPIMGTTVLTVPTYKLFYGLIKQRWFSKMQAKTLFVPDTMFEQYYSDSLKMTKESLINITLSNGNYTLKNGFEKATAKVLIIVGGKELSIMKKSAKLLEEKAPNGQLYVADKMGHGELSLCRPNEYTNLLKDFFRV